MRNDILNAVLSFSIVVLSSLVGFTTYSENNTNALTGRQLETLEEVRDTLEEQLGVVGSTSTEESLLVPVEIITEAELRAEQEAKLAADKLEAEKITAANKAADLASRQAVTEAEKAAAAKQAEAAAIAAEKMRQEQAKLEASKLAAEQAARLAAEQKAIAQAEAKAKADALAAQVAAQKASRKSRAS